MKTPLAIFIEARALLSDPAHWCKGALAKDYDGCSVTVLNPNACSFCLVGAFIKCAGGFVMYPDTLDRIFSEANQLTDCRAAAFNDHSGTNHHTMLKALDRAIDYAKGPLP